MAAVDAGDAAPPVENDSIETTASESTQEGSSTTDKVHTQLLRLHRMLDERGQSQVKSLEELQSCCDTVRRRAQQAKLQFQEQYDALTSRLTDKVEETQCRGEGAASPSTWRPPASGSLEASLASPHTRHAILLHALEVVASIPWRVQQRSLTLRVFDAWATSLYMEEAHTRTVTPYSDADFFDVEEGYGPEWDVLGLVAEHVKLQAEMDFWSKEALNLAEANACMSSFSAQDALAPESESVKLESGASMPEEDRDSDGSSTAKDSGEVCEQVQPQASTMPELAAVMHGEAFQTTLAAEVEWHSESSNGSAADGGVEAESAASMGSAVDEVQEEEADDEGDQVELLLKCTPTTAPDEFGRSLCSDSSSGKEEVSRDALQVYLAEAADEHASEFAAAPSSMSPSLNQCGLDFSEHLDDNTPVETRSEVAFDGASTAGPDELLPVGEDASHCIVDDTVTCETPKSLHDLGSEDELAFEELSSTYPEEALADATAAAVEASTAPEDDHAADVEKAGNNLEQADGMEEVAFDDVAAADGSLETQEEKVQQEDENTMNSEKHMMKDNAQADVLLEKDADCGYPSDAECDVELASLPSMPQHEQLYGGHLAGAASHGCLEVSIYTPSIRTTSLRSPSEEFLDCMDELSFFDADTGSQMEKANCSDEESEEICHDNISLAVSSDTNSNHVHTHLDTPKSASSRVRDMTARLTSAAASLCGGGVDARYDSTRNSDQYSCQSSEQPPHDLQHTLDDYMHVEIVEEAATETRQAESAHMLAQAGSSGSPRQQPDEEGESVTSVEKPSLEGGDCNEKLQLQQHESEQVAVSGDQLDLDHPEMERLGGEGIKSSSSTSREHEGGSPPSSLRMCRTTSRKCCARRRQSTDCAEHGQGKQLQATPHHCAGVALEERVPASTATGDRGISTDEVLDTSVVDLELGPEGVRPSEQPSG